MKSGAVEIEKKRSENIQEIASTHFDALIIGGGINGAVSALALRTHGVNVALFEKNDFFEKIVPGADQLENPTHVSVANS